MTTEFSADNDSAISALIESIRQSEQRLASLVEVDPNSAQSQHAREFLQQRSQFEPELPGPAVESRFSIEFRILLDLLPGMICFKDTRNRILLVNQKVADSVGLTVDMIEGRSCEEIYPDDAARFYLDDLEVIESGQPKLGYVEVMQNQAGREVWVQTDKIPYYGPEGEIVGIVVMARDVTERKETEEALRASEERFRALELNSWDAVHLLSHEGIILYESPAVRRVLGYEPEDLIGRNSFEMIHPDDFARVAADFAPLATTPGITLTADVRVRHRDGSWRMMECIATNMLEHPAIQAIAVNYRDITERQANEQAIRASAEHFRFLDNLSQATRGLSDSPQILDVMSRMLGQYLKASRCAYADVESDGDRFTIINDYTDGCPTTVGNYELSLFGERAVNSLQRGETLVIRDVDTELTQEDGGDTFNAIGIKAIITCPLVKDGVLCALMAVHQQTPRDWQPRDVAIVQDVVERCWAALERRTAEEKLRDSRAFAQSIADNSTSLIFVFDLETRSNVYANRDLSEVLGYSSPEIAELGDRLLPLIIHPDDLPGVEETNREMAGDTENRVRDIEYRVKDAKGDVHWLWTRLSVFRRRPSGAAWQVMGTSQDITERKRAENALSNALEETERQVEARTAELATANAELQVAVASADTANLAKSEFLSRMSHELRTPMNAVFGYAQLLEMQYEDPKIKKFARAILLGGKHLLKMINEVLDISRVETGELSISPESVEFAEALSQAVILVQPMANAAKIRLIVHPLENEAVCVLADRQRLVQVLINLISNAIKYNYRGGRVEVRFRELDGGISRIEISDSGRGISEIDQAMLFQPFQRFGDLAIEGTGLGLALSERFARLMGGNLGLAESSPAGSTFYVELNTASCITAHAAIVHFDPLSTQALTSRRASVLYIEDNPSNMRLIETVLGEFQSICLIPAIDAASGLELARQHIPDLILLDLHLPDMPGEDVLNRLKLDPATNAIPVVILSADATQRQIDSLLKCGATDYLTKPIDLVLFFDILEKHLPVQ